MPDEEMSEVDDSLFPNPEDLADAEEIWNGGVEETEKGRPVGPFQAKIVSAALERSSSGDRLQIHYELEITTPGKFAGTTLHKYDGLGSAQQASISQNQLRRVGVETKKVDLKRLPAVLLELKDKSVLINCRVKGDFHNIFFSRLVSGSQTSAPRPSVPAGKSGKAPAAAGKGSAGKKF